MADRKRPSKAWETLDRSREEAELARIDALSDEELDRELREAGIDPTAIDATLAAPLLWVPTDEVSGRSPRRARTKRVLVVVALAAAVVVACAFGWRHHGGHAPPLLDPPPAAPGAAV